MARRPSGRPGNRVFPRYPRDISLNLRELGRRVRFKYLTDENYTEAFRVIGMLVVILKQYSSPVRA